MEIINDTLRKHAADAHRPVAERSIGTLLLEAGKITPEDAERIIRYQREHGLRFGDAAITLKIVAEADIQQFIAKQFQYPYLREGEADYPSELIAAYQPFSSEVEALRALRTQLLLRWFGTGRHGLAVIGVGASGKAASLLTANLAVVFSQLGEQTLIVDGNLRSPLMQNTFKLGMRQGLSDMLAQRDSSETICRIPYFVDLSVLPSGTEAPNPLELLNRSVFQDLCTQLMSRFDVVLCDAPPTGAGSDCFTIASRMGGAVLVATKNVTRHADMQAAAAQLKQSGVTLVGTILAED
jgi:chain length determinant protein tyrosine kinase EpsG